MSLQPCVEPCSWLAVDVLVPWVQCSHSTGQQTRALPTAPVPSCSRPGWQERGDFTAPNNRK